MSRKRSIRSKGNHGSILRQPCRYYLRGTCTRTSCEYWHPPECHFFKKKETGCKAGDKCLFPHYKVDEQPNQKPKKSYFQKRRESDDKNGVASCEKCITIGLCITSFRCTRFSPMQKVSEPIQRVRFTKSTQRQASILEKKGPSLGKINVKVPHQRSPYAMKLEDRSQEETERQERCARS